MSFLGSGGRGGHGIRAGALIEVVSMARKGNDAFLGFGRGGEIRLKEDGKKRRGDFPQRSE